jgi:hypothetical protein
MTMKTATRLKASDARPPVPDVLAPEGKRLNDRDRHKYSARFGHDFSQVRIYDGPHSGALTRSLGARGVATPGNVLLGPEEDRGPETLDHELAHVAQMEREGPDQGRQSAEKEARSAAAGQSNPLHAAASSTYLDDNEKKVPTPEQAAAVTPAATPAPTPAATPTPTPAATPKDAPVLPPPLVPTKAALQPGSSLPPDFWSKKYDLPQVKPLFTPGAGPATPRAGTPGDVLSALTKIPDISKAADKAGDKVTGDLGKAWTGSDTAGKIAMGVGAGSLAAGLAAPLLIPQTRDKALATPPYSLLQNATIPIGPVSVSAGLGQEKKIGVTVDVLKLLTGQKSEDKK